MEIIREYYNQSSLSSGINKRRREKILKILEGETNRKVILDVGCATGLLGRLLKEDNNYIIGIDISPKAIEKAKEFLDKAIVLDVENEELPFSKDYFDTIIFSEIISHLFLPERALLKLREVLKKDGKIIVTAPNFSIYTNRIKILFGRFGYTNKSLLDKGVIRFFNYYSLKNLLKETGFKIVQENHVIHHRIPRWLGGYLPNLFAFQIIVKAKKI